MQIFLGHLGLPKNFLIWDRTSHKLLSNVKSLVAILSSDAHIFARIMQGRSVRVVAAAAEPTSVPPTVPEADIEPAKQIPTCTSPIFTLLNVWWSSIYIFSWEMYGKSNNFREIRCPRLCLSQTSSFIHQRWFRIDSITFNYIIESMPTQTKGRKSNVLFLFIVARLKRSIIRSWINVE